MSKSRSVTSFEHRAPIYIDPRGGYVDITQPRGDRTKYTPEEARALAAEILAAADEVAGGESVER
jgi:hypothetical protein